METAFFTSHAFTYIVIPILIFFARICDVTIGTMRIVFVSKGMKTIAPILGFFEVLIWIIAISRIMENLDNWVNYIAYAAGFATGNYVGLLVEEKLAMGILNIRIITRHDASELIYFLNEKGYGTTSVKAKGSKENVHIIYTIVQRNHLKEVIEIIRKFNPKAFYSIEDIRFVNEGIFPIGRPVHKLDNGVPFKRWRRGK
jgi:uncharacterized protein YebE (UPF0316 family)